MNLAAHVRIVLYEYGRRGYSFDDAWVLAMRSLPKGKNDIEKMHLAEWKPILRWAKPHFRANFAQAPSSNVIDQSEQQHDHNDYDQQVQEERHGALSAL